MENEIEKEIEQSFRETTKYKDQLYIDVKVSAGGALNFYVYTIGGSYLALYLNNEIKFIYEGVTVQALVYKRWLLMQESEDFQDVIFTTQKVKLRDFHESCVIAISKKNVYVLDVETLHISMVKLIDWKKRI